MSNKVTIIFDAVDNATKEIGGITQELGKMGGVVGTVFGTIGGVALAATGAVVAGLGAATAALATTIEPASDLQETMNKVRVVFGNSADAVLEFGKNSAAALGMSSNEALTAAGTYGNLFSSIGLAEDKSADMSKALVTLAGDLASFNNVNPEEALAALRSGLVGETEPLKRFGVNLNEATIKAKALAMGLYKGKGEITASARAQAAYAIILEQTSLAQGDFARTSDGLANSQRILTAAFENVRAKLGTAILPLIEKVMKVVSTIVASDKFNAFIDGIAAGLGELANKAIAFIDNIDWATFFRIVQEGWDGFQNVIKTVVGVVVPWLQNLWTNFQIIWENIQGILKDGLKPGDIENILSLLWDGLTGGANWSEILKDMRAQLGKLGFVIKSWAEHVDWGGIVTSLLTELKEIDDKIIAWSKDPETQKEFQEVGNNIGNLIGSVMNLQVRTWVGVIGAWFAGGGFEDAMKPEEVSMTLAQKIVQGITEGFISGLLGVDLSPQVREWIRLAIVNANPAQVMTNLLFTAVTQVASNITKLTQTNWEGVGREITRFIGSGIGQGTQALVNAAVAAVRSAFSAASSWLGGVSRGSTPAIHGRASGGSVNAGQPYIVGEKGAELFVPNRSGQIISNSSLASSPRHAGGGVNIVLNYSPMMSLGDRNEAREKLLPFIRDGLRAAGVA